MKTKTASRKLAKSNVSKRSVGRHLARDILAGLHAYAAVLKQSPPVPPGDVVRAARDGS